MLLARSDELIVYLHTRLQQISLDRTDLDAATGPDVGSNLDVLIVKFQAAIAHEIEISSLVSVRLLRSQSGRRRSAELASAWPDFHISM